MDSFAVMVRSDYKLLAKTFTTENTEVTEASCLSVFRCVPCGKGFSPLKSAARGGSIALQQEEPNAPKLYSYIYLHRCGWDSYPYHAARRQAGAPGQSQPGQAQSL